MYREISPNLSILQTPGGEKGASNKCPKGSPHQRRLAAAKLSPPITVIRRLFCKHGGRFVSAWREGHVYDVDSGNTSTRTALAGG